MRLPEAGTIENIIVIDTEMSRVPLELVQESETKGRDLDQDSIGGSQSIDQNHKNTTGTRTTGEEISVVLKSTTVEGSRRRKETSTTIGTNMLVGISTQKTTGNLRTENIIANTPVKSKESRHTRNP